MLHEIERATGPITIQELSQRLNLEPGVVADMVAFWVRKERLVTGADTAVPHHTAHCGGDCQGPAACHFVAKVPASFTVTKDVMR
ncbi:MAG: hypothetical protein KJ069_05240 [Anaerolineae bacterium]|nr:hypothetical protein [Anaerolineae bacterium]